jgi:hypothetical protein
MSNDWWQIAWFAWSVLQALMTFGVWVYAWSATRGRAHQDELEEIRVERDERLRTIEAQMAMLEERLAHLPTATDIAALGAAVARIEATVDTMDRRTNRIEDWLSRERRT